MAFLSGMPPGQDRLDYNLYLLELVRLNPDMPLIMEHMKERDYPAAGFIRKTAGASGVSILWFRKTIEDNRTCPPHESILASANT